MVLLLASAWGLSEGAPEAARPLLLRLWTIGGGAVLSVLPPHLLYPDPYRPFALLANADPRALLRLGLRRWSPVVLLALGPVPLIALAGLPLPGRAQSVLAPLTAALLTTLGVGLLAYAQFATMGLRAQAWQDGKKGGWYRALAGNTPFSFSGIPPGLVPAVMATSALFGAAILTVVASALLTPVAGGAFVWVPGALLAAYAALRLLASVPAYDRDYYATAAFYGEVFSSGGLRVEEREALPYGGVYWAPARLRPHVWAMLRQMDRRLPLGRFVALGHAGLWLLYSLDVSGGLIAAYLLLFATAKNATVFVTASPSMAPPPFQTLFLPRAGWTATRMMVNLRWTAAWVMSLAIVAAFAKSFGMVHVLAWTLIDLFLAWLMAWIATQTAETRYLVKYV